MLQVLNYLLSLHKHFNNNIMNLIEAENLAVSLMKQNGIWELGWRFSYGRALVEFGSCNYTTKVIKLSKHLTSLNNIEQVKDTILHEIAHAIAGFKAGHGYEWKLACIRIGAKPEQYYVKSDVNTPKLKYFAVCGACGQTYEKARLKLKEVKRACKCQSHKLWDEKILIEFKARY
jgi:predicted SprT family Zn-dependent metalloprotease